ncbi:DUF1330 domain-containing protein [Pelagibius marinus]|uniref:DUF1330 domain-containing protein n=1 Tax=Pelagibius marinus TaxID=2762760 RepID=UPI00187277CD|nr:DUF1330 domain-containing protein [Pelagibius marinus]
MTAPLGAYAVAHLRQVDFGADIIEYLKRIDATLAPYGGRYVVHGARATVLEGDWPGDLVVIGFPDRESAEAWYNSPAYRAIIALRTANSVGDVILVDGVTADHRATDILGTAA